MNDERKIYQPNESARVAVQKFSPTKNDVLVVRTPDNLDYKQMALLAEQWRPIAQETGCIIMFTTDGADIELFNEKEMNELGWFRLHDGNPGKH